MIIARVEEHHTKQSNKKRVN